MDTNQMEEQTNRVADTARNLTNKAKERARDLTNRAKEKSVQMGQYADQYVHENAWMTIGVVAVAAGLIGFMLGRSSASED